MHVYIVYYCIVSNSRAFARFIATILEKGSKGKEEEEDDEKKTVYDEET